MVSFKMVPSWCQCKSHVTSYSLPEKPVPFCMSLKYGDRVTFFDSNCIEMGIEPVEMNLQYGKL